MEKKTEDKIKSCAGNDGCAPDLNDGKAIANKVRQVGVRDGLLETPHMIACECGQTFEMVHFEEKDKFGNSFDSLYPSRLLGFISIN